MRDLSALVQPVRTGTAAILAAGLAAAQERLFAGAGNSILLIAVIIAFVLAQVAASVFEKSLENWDGFRRYLLGRHNIEGYWTDVVTIDGARIAGVLDISLEGDQFRIHGIQYNEQGEQIASWNDTILRFDGQKVRYLYETRYQGTNITQYGYSEITFCRTSESVVPDSCNGFFLDLGQPGKTHSFHAIRQSGSFGAAYAKNVRAAVCPLFAV